MSGAAILLMTPYPGRRDGSESPRLQCPDNTVISLVSGNNMVFLLRPVVAYTLPQLQHQMKINIVPETSLTCRSVIFTASGKAFTGSATLFCFAPANIINSVYIFKEISVRLLQFS